MTFLSWHLPSTGRCHCPGGICIKKLVCHARWWLLLCWGHSNKKFCGFSCRIFFGWLGTKYLFMSLINLVSTSVLTEASFLFLGLNWLSLLNAVWKFFLWMLNVTYIPGWITFCRNNLGSHSFFENFFLFRF